MTEIHARVLEKAQKLVENMDAKKRIPVRWIAFFVWYMKFRFSGRHEMLPCRVSSDALQYRHVQRAHFAPLSDRDEKRTTATIRSKDGRHQETVKERSG